MGVIDKLKEGIFRIRVVPAPTGEDNTTFAKQGETLPEKLDEATQLGKRIDLSDLTNILTIKGNRNQKYEIFEEMVSDGRIGAAIEMYANDTVQYNPEGKLVWVESKNTDVAKYGNKLLEDLNVSENIWSWAYSLVLYGDVYLELFKSTSNVEGKKPTLLLEPNKLNPSVRTEQPIKGAKLARYIEKVPNPAEIYDLQYKGKTSGFVRSPEDIQNDYKNNTYLYTGICTKLNILNPTKFVHICLSPNINRHPEKFNLIKPTTVDKVTENGLIDGSDEEGSGDTLSFTVKTGQSILENVYGAYQTLKLKEESVLLERITKSSITRIIQVELGDLPESQKRIKLQEIKNQIEQQIIMNKETGSIQSRSGAQPTENIIYTTTKNGKGAITTVNIGGDADIGNLDDVSDSENKLYGALLIPKALLGADMDGSGLSNGGSLTEMNTTYARRIKRLQVALQSGIKTLINIFALSDGLQDAVNNFEVRLTPIITVEDNRRDELLQNKIRNVNDTLSLFNDIDTIDENTKLKMIIEWLSKYLNQQDIVDIINEKLKELETEQKEQETDKAEEAIEGDNNDYEMSSGGGPSDHFEPEPIERDEPTMDTDIDISNNEDTESNTSSEPTNTPQLSNQTDLADIEGEDLL